MNKKQIDKMVLVDFCNNKDLKDKLYKIHKIGEEKEEVKEEDKKE
jgi:hypothetical protein